MRTAEKRKDHERSVCAIQKCTAVVDDYLWNGGGRESAEDSGRLKTGYLEYRRSQFLIVKSHIFRGR